MYSIGLGVGSSSSLDSSPLELELYLGIRPGIFSFSLISGSSLSGSESHLRVKSGILSSFLRLEICYLIRSGVLSSVSLVGF